MEAIKVINIFGKDTGLIVAPNADNTKLGLLSSEYDLILPFEYDNIEPILHSHNTIVAKKGTELIVIELE